MAQVATIGHMKPKTQQMNARMSRKLSDHALRILGGRCQVFPILGASVSYPLLTNLIPGSTLS